MKKRTRHKGLRLASGLIAACLVVVFSVGNALASSFASPVNVHQVHAKAPFIAVENFTAERPGTKWITVIWHDVILPGHKPKVEAHCNDPTEKSDSQLAKI